MNDKEREQLRRRVLVRLGWKHDPRWYDWKAPDGSRHAHKDAPDHTRDANAALRDLAPLLGAVTVSNILEALPIECGSDEWDRFDEAVALALCLAVDALP